MIPSLFPLDIPKGDDRIAISVQFLNSTGGTLIVTGRESKILRLLAAIESHPLLTQRKLASELQIALGTTNHLVHSLQSRKLVELSRTGARAVYRLTPSGVSEKLRLLRLQIDKTMDHYSEIRDRISMSLESLAVCRTDAV